MGSSKNKFSFLASNCFGLFLAQNFYMLFYYYLSPDFEWISLNFQIENYLENLVLFYTIGLVISLLFSILIGLPLYFLVQKYFRVGYVFGAIVGAFVGVSPYILAGMLGWNVPGASEISAVLAVCTLTFCGASAGACFVFLEK